MAALIYLALLTLYSLVERRVSKTLLTAPILFTATGLAAGAAVPSFRELSATREQMLAVAELGLVLLLFTDACRTDLRLLRHIGSLPARLLTSGLLLTVGLGTVLAKLILPELSLWEAAIVSCVLAPTDAGLGQVVVESPLVPAPIRQALNVEAGLNDGICVPFFMFSMALAEAQAQAPSLGRLILEQLGWGALLGAALGLTGGGLLAVARQRGWTERAELALLVIPLWCFALSEHLGASMFIAAFVAGLATQRAFPEAGRHAVEFSESWGQLLNWAVFFLFGLRVTALGLELSPALWLYALASLTVVRMLPVALALRGTGLDRVTVLFMGWFGPRGLASIVLGTVYMERELHLAHEATMVAAVTLTVLLSTLLHGLSANPGLRAYARALPPQGGG